MTATSTSTASTSTSPSSPPKTLQAHYLVRNRRTTTDTTPSPVLFSHQPLSFWGGLDPTTGIVLDHHHDLHGSCVSHKWLCLPSGRGSCTASQVLLEVLWNGVAPRGIVLRDRDGLVAVGALMAQELLGHEGLDILVVDEYGALESMEYLAVDANGVIREATSSGGGGTSMEDAATTTTTQGDDEPLTLTEFEQDRLAQATSDAERQALHVLFRYARIVQATHYVPVTQAHMDACTYIGPGGLQVCRSLLEQGGRVKVPTTLNSMSTDRRQDLGGPNTTQAKELGETYVALGCRDTFSCAPYWLLPPTQDHLVWGESNAVVFANSVWGAKTEKYADYMDLCGALTGMVPCVGVHADRRPTVLLDASQLELENDEYCDWDVLYPILGHVCGRLSDGGIPLVLGLEHLTPTLDHLQAFCAAFGTTAKAPLCHLANITHEAKEKTLVEEWKKTLHLPTTLVRWSDLRETYQALDNETGSDVSVSLVALGNPHLSLDECDKLAHLLPSHKHPNVRVVACMARALYAQVPTETTQKLDAFGVEFVHDTSWCMLLHPPIIPEKGSTIMTNSGKYAHYGPGLTQRNFRFGSLSECLQTAHTGQLSRRGVPGWMSRRGFASVARYMRYLR